MTARATYPEAQMRRTAKVAREVGVTITVELPDGTKLHFGPAAKQRAANALDEMFE